MHITVDASNIRQGGGVTHLSEVLARMDLPAAGVRRLVVWAPDSTLRSLPDRPNISKRNHRLIERGRLSGELFRRAVLESSIGAETSLLWVPGGTYSGRFRPFVSMLQNLLPFERVERDRFKYSTDWIRFHYLFSRQLQTFRRADGLIHVSEHGRRVLSAYGDFDTVPQRVIHHGLHSRFFIEPRPQLELSDFSPLRPLRVLYVSIINLYKHQTTLVEACANIRKMGVPLELHLVGPARPAAEKILRRTLHKFDPGDTWVKWEGEVPYQSMHEVYMKADLYAFMSSCESFGTILLEAMAAGLPILCSNRSAIPEVNGGTCPAVDPEDVGQVTNGLLRLIRDKVLREKLAQAAQERAHQFSWQRCADETLEFLVECRRRFEATS